MDCCGNTKQNRLKENKENNMDKENKEKKLKGGKHMETKNIMLWAVIGILLVATIFLTVKASSLGAQTPDGNGKLDTTGWTSNEIMYYEMHGTIPARVASGGNSAPASGGMVGGC